MDKKKDVEIKIAVGQSRQDKRFKNKTLLWSALAKKLKKTTRTFETVAEYAHMSKDKQGQVKDVGGFVGGHLKDGRRLKANVKCRTLVTLDVDFAGPYFWDNLTMLEDYACVLYSTHKHTKKEPRYRLIIPLAREVTAEEYEAIARRLADNIGIEMFDATTYQASRLMYWPSTPKDGDYVYKAQNGEIVEPDEILATYEDWTDVSYWPTSSGETQKIQRTIKKQADPLEKQGVVGAFCRTYSIHDAIEKFIPDVYVSCAISGRYTYSGGSTSGGLVIYEDKYAYSNHATDPAGEQLCNAFDLVRIHLYGEKDKKSAEDTEATKLPSYKDMVELASKDTLVKKCLIKDRIQQSKEDFADVDTSNYTEKEEDYDDTWMENLDVNQKGNLVSSIGNVVTILENDRRFKGIFAYDEFNRSEMATRDLPWRKIATEVEKPIRDADDSNLRLFLENNYGISGKDKIKDAIKVVANAHSFHPVRAYLDKCEWDGVPRVDTLLIDYLGAEDTEYTRTVTRKTLVGAVARIYEPGVKFDTMLTLTGPQGIGKSSLFNYLGGAWFSDSLTTVSGKEAYEQLQGVWIMELGELSAMKKSEVEATKQFLSKREDRYRRAYGERVEAFPRQNIFVGTTNEKQFLRDETGGRRFWVVDLVNKAERDLFKELDAKTIASIWGEAIKFYRDGEPLILDEKMEQEARRVQEAHGEDNPKIGIVKEYLETLLPKDWNSRQLYERLEFLHNYEFEKPGEIQRTKVCAAEIWCEVYGRKLGDLNTYETREINKILDRIEGWEKAKSPIKFGKVYGLQRGYKRVYK